MVPGGAGIVLRRGIAALTGTVALVSASGPLRQLRFSPDGQYVLAEDQSGIAVLAVKPFSILFRVIVQDARFAGFTPDSRQLLLVRPHAHDVTSPQGSIVSLTERLERWSLADREMVSSQKMPPGDCTSEGLSPDGRYFACVYGDGMLRLTEIGNGRLVCERKGFATAAVLDANGAITDRDRIQVWHVEGMATINFSPDGRYIIANPMHGRTVAWDLRERREVPLVGGLKVSRDFWTFVAPDRLLRSMVENNGHPSISAKLVEVPSGRVLSKPKIPRGPIWGAADPGFAIIRPFGWRGGIPAPTDRAAAVEIGTGQVIIGPTPWLDVFEGRYVVQQRDGLLGLYERPRGLLATVDLNRK